jgi:hypothetical protein
MLSEKKVVVVGEFSGLGKSFVAGFRGLGYQTIHLGGSDGYKNFTDKKFNSKYLDIFILWISALRISFYKDTSVLFLSPFVFKNPLFLNVIFNKLLLRNATKSVYYAAVSDSVYWRHYPSEATRNTLTGWLRDLNFKVHLYGRSDRYYDYNLRFLRIVDKVLVASEEYHQVYAGLVSTEILRYPVEIMATKASANSVYVMSHGSTRKGFKGTYSIEKLLRELKQDCHFFHQVSFKDFVLKLQNTKIYLDQFNTAYPGMAALFALQFCDFVVTSINYDMVADKNYKEECPMNDIRSLDEATVTKMVGASCQWERNIHFLRKYHDPMAIAKSIFA